MNRREIKSYARFRAGLVLENMVGTWEPDDDLLERVGPDVVEEIRTEMGAIAQRMIGTEE